MSTAFLAQGATITWGSSTLTNITRITQNGGNSSGNEPEVSVAHLGSCHCKEEPYIKTWAAPSNSGGGNTLQVDFMGESPFEKDEVKNFVVSTPTTNNLINLTDCTCLSVQVTAQVGDVIRGSASIKFA